jgi:hypothetical protein
MGVRLREEGPPYNRRVIGTSWFDWAVAAAAVYGVIVSTVALVMQSAARADERAFLWRLHTLLLRLATVLERHLHPGPTQPGDNPYSRVFGIRVVLHELEDLWKATAGPAIHSRRIHRSEERLLAMVAPLLDDDIDVGEAAAQVDFEALLSMTNATIRQVLKALRARGRRQGV